MTIIEFRLAKALRGCHISGPVSPKEIAAAEQTLGLYFPPSYRDFLARYGAALGRGIEIAGLPKEPTGPNDTPLWSHVVHSTDRYRPDSLPPDSIAISHDGSEFGYFLVCSRTDPGYEGSVIEWGPAHEGGKEFASDFLSFVDIFTAQTNF